MASEAGSAASRKRQLLADGALLGVVFIWGSTFVMVKDLIEQVPPMQLLAVRFGIASIPPLLFITVMRRWRGFSLRELAWGSAVGVVLGLGYTLQTVGLQYTTASHGAFVTGLLVVIAPVMGIFVMRQVPSRWAIAGILLATVGLAMLSLRLEEGFQVNFGDLLILGCAFAFALHIALVARTSRMFDSFRLSVVQIVVAGALNAVGALLFEWPWKPMSAEMWAGAAFLGIMATTVGISVLVAVLRYTSVVHAALINSMEPVFGALFGIWLQGDYLGPIPLTGAALIVVGMLVTDLAPYILKTAGTRAAA
jgi:drug/metabolite transporter (DMT)-like permease